MSKSNSNNSRLGKMSIAGLRPHLTLDDDSDYDFELRPRTALRRSAFGFPNHNSLPLLSSAADENTCCSQLPEVTVNGTPLLQSSTSLDAYTPRKSCFTGLGEIVEGLAKTRQRPRRRRRRKSIVYEEETDEKKGEGDEYDEKYEAAAALAAKIRTAKVRADSALCGTRSKRRKKKRRRKHSPAFRNFHSSPAILSMIPASDICSDTVANDFLNGDNFVDWQKVMETTAEPRSDFQYFVRSEKYSVLRNVLCVDGSEGSGKRQLLDQLQRAGFNVLRMPPENEENILQQLTWYAATVVHSVPEMTEPIGGGANNNNSLIFDTALQPDTIRMRSAPSPGSEYTPVGTPRAPLTPLSSAGSRFNSASPSLESSHSRRGIRATTAIPLFLPGEVCAHSPSDVEDYDTENTPIHTSSIHTPPPNMDDSFSGAGFFGLSLDVDDFKDEETTIARVPKSELWIVDGSMLGLVYAKVAALCEFPVVNGNTSETFKKLYGCYKKWAPQHLVYVRCALRHCAQRLGSDAPSYYLQKSHPKYEKLYGPCVDARRGAAAGDSPRVVALNVDNSDPLPHDAWLGCVRDCYY